MLDEVKFILAIPPRLCALHLIRLHDIRVSVCKIAHFAVQGGRSGVVIHLDWVLVGPGSLMH